MKNKGNLNSPEEDFVILGQSKSPTYPEGFAEGSLSWTNVAREIVDALSDEWFAEYTPQPIGKILPKNALAGQEKIRQTFAQHLFVGEGVNLIPGFHISLEDLGDQVSIPESTQGKLLLETLEKNGISWTYKTSFHDEDHNVVERADATTEGIAQWASYFDMPVVQTFRIFKNAKGKETVLWSSPMLVGTRVMDFITTINFQGSRFEISETELRKGVLPYGQWATNMHIPAVFKRIFFLSETPFPSSIMNMPRSTAFEGINPNNYPKPALIHNKQIWVEGYFGHNGTELLDVGSVMPEMIEVGWTFSSTSTDEIQKILEVVTNGLIRFASYLEDGFLNYRNIDFGFQYDLALFSGLCMDENAKPGIDAHARSQWIPATRIGLEIMSTLIAVEKRTELKSQNNRPQLREALNYVVYQGSGFAIPALTNDLVYSFLLKEQNWGEIDYVLDTAIRLGIPVETENSMSNLAIAKFEQGLFEESRALFLRAIENLQQYLSHEIQSAHALEIVAEGYFYLAQIADREGKDNEAAEYRKKCAEAGGYETYQETEDPKGSSEPSGLGGKAKIGAESSGLSSSKGKIGTESPANSSSISGGLPKTSEGKIGGETPRENSPVGGGLGKQSGNKIGNDSEKPIAKFCSSCGTKFGSNEEKFCGSCGTKRL